MCEYPRVAVISSNPMRDDISNGILMRSLFAGWPQDKLVQFYFPVATRQRPQFDVCKRYAMVRPTGAVRTFVDDQQTTTAPKSRRDAMAARWVHRLRTMPRVQGCLKLAQELWYGHAHLGRVLGKLLDRERPEVVYFLAGSYGLTRLVHAACQQRAIPIVLHVTDDFVESLYANCPFSHQMMTASQRAFRRLAADATARAAISPSMAAAYEQRYGQPWSWYTTLVEGGEVDPPPVSQGPLQLTYAGNLGLRRFEVLRQLGLQLAQLRRQGQADAHLDIYASPEQLAVYGESLDLPQVTLKQWVPMSELPQIFAASDLVVHVESSQADVAALTRFSLSTKISQYMMASRGILAIGPPQLASMQVIEQAGAGVVLSDLSTPSNQAQLAEFLSDDDLRRQCGLQGHAWASRWCGTARRADFAACLAEAAKRAPATVRAAA